MNRVYFPKIPNFLHPTSKTTLPQAENHSIKRFNYPAKEQFS